MTETQIIDDADIHYHMERKNIRSSLLRPICTPIGAVVAFLLGGCTTAVVVGFASLREHKGSAVSPRCTSESALASPGMYGDTYLDLVGPKGAYDQFIDVPNDSRVATFFKQGYAQRNEPRTEPGTFPQLSRPLCSDSSHFVPASISCWVQQC